MQAWIAKAEYQQELQRELQSKSNQFTDVQCQGNLFYGPDINQDIWWALDSWSNAELIGFDSIKDAARQLRQINRVWVNLSSDFFQRSKLIWEQCCKAKDRRQILKKKIQFEPGRLPQQIPAFSLISANQLLCSNQRSNPFPGLDPGFVPDRSAPSRAYLKLWEALIRLGQAPGVGDTCLELGASPGGWSWVLDSLGCRLTAVDRSPLEAGLMDKASIEFVQGDAFAMLPVKVGPIDWLFSDLACEPAKLLEFVQHWLASNTCQNFICSLKMKGRSNLDVIKGFARIPNSKVVHLYHNKHELCWLCSPYLTDIDKSYP